jgi:hypothetical protein
MQRSIKVSIASLALVVVACATTTSFTSTWKAPDVETFEPQGKKVAAVFISNDEAGRRAAEDTLVQRLNAAGAQGIAAYTLIPSDELRDMERVKARLGEAGVDGILTMRVIEESQRVSYTPANPAFLPYYMRFSNYWNYGWGAMYEPQRATTDTVVVVETLAYSLTRDKLLWAGTSRTVNPADIPKFVKQLAEAVSREMRKQGLLAS